MNDTIEDLTIELFVLKETKRQVEGAMGDVRKALKETREPDRRSFYQESLPKLRQQVKDLNTQIADRERRRKHLQREKQR